ncbi:MAG TPA: ribosome small subunit-dependent GTPase A [Microbacteriaceae bacterium]|nr:ribosome small subunit-dependent GTPase A [Microbacteriaceae bacterium]
MSWWDDADGPDDDEGPDESDVRVRPNPRGSRPRTKRRPAHAGATAGFVTAVNRGRYTVLLDADAGTRAGEDEPPGGKAASDPPHAAGRTVNAARGSGLRRERVVTGDFVDLVGDRTGAPGSLARIVRIHPRSSLLRRSADDTDQVERIVVANADQMLIVVAASRPRPRVRLVDRLLVAAYDAEIKPLLCVTKADEADPAPFLAQFRGLGLTTFASGLTSLPHAALTAALAGHRTVLIGHSGVGKSTLINRLVPGALRATGQVNAVTGRGRHTSSSSRALKVPSDPPGWVIDTPGVRSFGLGHVETAHVVAAFDEVAALAALCPRGCRHTPETTGCRLAAALRDDTVPAATRARIDSVLRLLAALGPPGDDGGATTRQPQP